jgi:Neutral/alkaline non-lysosomal ceramidase, N-terminal
MRKHMWLAVGIALVLGCAGPASIDESLLRVGTASATVNPPDGTYMAGYDQDRKSTGVHDDLYAKAVVFDDGKTAVALVVVDVIGIQYDTVQAIREAAAAKTTAIPPEHIIVQSTHTHCGPDVIGIYGPDETHTGRNAAYMEQLVNTAAEQVARAADARQPTTFVVAETQCTGWAVNDSEPDVVDNSVTLLQCRDAQGEPIATLTHFACHPTVLDGDTTQVSADWVGAFYKEMAARVPGQHIYLQGGVGGWIQPETPERSFALAERYGKDLAAKAVAALESPQPMAADEVRFASKAFGMPNDNAMFKQISSAGLGLIPREMDDAIGTEVAWFAVGDAQFATHPGETAPAFTWATEDLMDSGPKFVLGLGLDELGYIIKPEYFDDPSAIPHAEYLTSMSPGRDAGPAMMAALDAVIP